MRRETVINNPKELLDKNAPITIGDFVTTNDNSPMKAYVVRDIGKEVALIIGLGITELGDDVLLKEHIVSTSSLIFVDESLVTVNSILWEEREAIIKEDKVLHLFLLLILCY